MKSDFIWFDGKLVPYEEANVHMLTPTLHYGLGVFEGIRCYQTSKGPGIFRLQEHLKRFINSIHILGILEFPYSMETMRQAIFQTISVNGFSECYIRPLMYLQGPLGLNMDQSVPKLAIAAWEWGPYLGDEAIRSGIHVMVSSYTRFHPNINMTKSKVSGNYVNSMMVKTLALRAGFDEAVILDPNGFVSECTGENLFMVRDGVLYTPPKEAILEGITRDTVMKLAADMRLPLVEEMITRDQLYIADEVFITGTAAEVVGVRMIDFRQIGEGKVGPITQSIYESYKETVCGNGLHSGEWLEYLPMNQALDQEKIV